jgi:hypothetical protein
VVHLLASLGEQLRDKNVEEEEFILGNLKNQTSRAISKGADVFEKIHRGCSIFETYTALEVKQSHIEQLMRGFGNAKQPWLWLQESSEIRSDSPEFFVRSGGMEGMERCELET